MSDLPPQTIHKTKDKYSLKFMLFSNFCSFMGGLVIHYLTEHHRH